MPQDEKTLIMKFGGAATHTPELFADIANLIIERSFDFPRIAIVVSAMGDMTDYLIGLAHQVHPTPPKREYDMLVSAGERISIALLAMALAKKGREAISFTGSQSGIITTQHHSEARIVDVRPHRLIPCLEAKKFVIVAGFQGVSEDKEITTLGRGGSDTTAVALGIALQATHVEFYKDVGGIYESDPKMSNNPQKYTCLNYSQAIEIVSRTGGRVLHPRAIGLAQKNALPLHIFSFEKAALEGTRICEGKKSKVKPCYEDSLSAHMH